MAGPHFVANFNTAVFATSVTLDKPTGTAERDVMLALIEHGTQNITSIPTGWEVFKFLDHDASKKSWFFKVAGNNEPANYTWQLAASSGIVGQVVTYRNADTLSPLDVIGTTNTGTDSSAEANAVTTTKANTLLVGWFGNSNGTITWTAPGGMTERSDTEGIEWADESIAAAGSTGGRTATASGNNNWFSLLVALAPSLGRAGGAIQYCRQKANQSVVDSTALVSITDLKFRVHANRTYLFAFLIAGQSTSQTQGQRFAVSAPATTRFAYTVSINTGPGGTAAFFEGAGTASDDAVVANQVELASSNFLNYIHGNIVPSADGVLQARFANENVTGAETTTVVAGSIGWLVEV